MQKLVFKGMSAAGAVNARSTSIVPSSRVTRFYANSRKANRRDTRRQAIEYQSWNKSP